MRYHLAPIPCRPWLINGLSHGLIESHYENNYGGAMRRLNAISAKLATIDYASTPPHELNALKRDELTALNSTLLHELYFSSMGGDGRVMFEPMSKVLEADFGSVARWQDEFVAMGRGLGGGSGWVLLSYVPRDGRLVNQYASDHSQSIAGAIPILALDMYEHAYHLDFGANAAAYVDAFMRNIDWKEAHARYEDALHARPPRPLVQPEFGQVPAIEPEEVKAMLDSGAPVQVIDARPRHYFTRSPEIMAAAQWRDPERIDDWVGELSTEKPVVVFCVYGFHVGCRTAQALRSRGFDARYMAGGHSAWKALGGELKLHA